MKRFLCVACVVVLGLCGAKSASAKETGTTWGTVFAVGCDDGIGSNHACYLQLSAGVGDLTVLKCYAPWDGWCNAATVGQTVIVSSYSQSVLPAGSAYPLTQLVLDPAGPTHSRY